MKELNSAEVQTVSGGISPAVTACAIAFAVITLTIASSFHDHAESVYRGLSKAPIFKP